MNRPSPLINGIATWIVVGLFYLVYKKYGFETPAIILLSLINAKLTFLNDKD